MTLFDSAPHALSSHRERRCRVRRVVCARFCRTILISRAASASSTNLMISAAKHGVHGRHMFAVEQPTMDRPCGLIVTPSDGATLLGPGGGSRHATCAYQTVQAT
jgi:hypothetical protein